MRKKVFGRHLSRGRKSREALLASLIRAVILHGQIITTKAKAKAIQGQIDKIITLAKKNSVSAQRKALADIKGDRKLIEDLFKRIAPAFKDRTSGFTRLILLPPRQGDQAEMARIEWVEEIANKKEVIKEKPVKAETKEKKTKTIVAKKIKTVKKEKK